MGMASLLRGTDEARADALFDVLDLGDCSKVTASDLARFIPQVASDLSAFVGSNGFAATMTKFLFEQIQQTIGASEVPPGQKVEIRRTQFIRLCLTSPLWYDCFMSAILPKSHKSSLGSFRCVQPPCSGFNMDMLVALWTRCQGDEGRRGLNLPRFRVFMMEDFECTPDMLPIATRVFKLFDDDGSGELDWRELVAGLANVCIRPCAIRLAGSAMTRVLCVCVCPSHRCWEGSWKTQHGFTSGCTTSMATALLAVKRS